MRDKFINIGNKAFVNVDKVKYIVSADAEKVRRELAKRNLTRSHKEVFDGTSVKETRSMLIFDDDKVNAAIEELNAAAKQVNDSMNELPNYWEGAAYDKARAVYEEQYQGLLTNTVPKAVEDFRDYINQCKDKIIELDQQLAGN